MRIRLCVLLFLQWRSSVTIFLIRRCVQVEETVAPLAPPHLVNDFVRNVRKRVRYITLCESSVDDDGEWSLEVAYFSAAFLAQRSLQGVLDIALSIYIALSM